MPLYTTHPPLTIHSFHLLLSLIYITFPFFLHNHLQDLFQDNEKASLSPLIKRKHNKAVVSCLPRRFPPNPFSRGNRTHSTNIYMTHMPGVVLVSLSWSHAQFRFPSWKRNVASQFFFCYLTLFLI
jgi:hypothetical protein